MSSLEQGNKAVPTQTMLSETGGFLGIFGVLLPKKGRCGQVSPAKPSTSSQHPGKKQEAKQMTISGRMA